MNATMIDRQLTPEQMTQWALIARWLRAQRAERRSARRDRAFVALLRRFDSSENHHDQ